MRILAMFIALVAGGVAVPPASAYGQKKTAVTDDGIYDQVRRKLADDADVKGAGLDVAVHEGTVTLKGKVGSDRAKAKAERLAKKVHGVKKVDNQLVVSN
jgi:osmotically-inducible protein OsmY